MQRCKDLIFPKKKGCKTFMPFWCLHAILSISKRSEQAPIILQPMGSSGKKNNRKRNTRELLMSFEDI